MGMESAEIVTVATTDGATDAIEAGSYLYGIVVTTDATNDCVCTVKNGASGTTKLIVKCPGTDDCREFMFSARVKFDDTINITTTGTGGTSYVFVGK